MTPTESGSADPAPSPTPRSGFGRVSRCRWIALSAVTVLLVLVVAGEFAVRAVVRHQVSTQAGRALPGGVDVSLGGRPILVDLVDGHIGTLRLHAADTDVCHYDGVDVALTLTRLSVGSDGTAGHEVRRIAATVTLDPAALGRAAAQETGRLGTPTVTMNPTQGSLTFRLGLGGLLAVEEVPTLDGNAISLTPRRMTVLGQPAPAALTRQLTGGGAMRRSLGTLPFGLVATDLHVTPAGLVLDLGVGRTHVHSVDRTPC